MLPHRSDNATANNSSFNETINSSRPAGEKEAVHISTDSGGADRTGKSQVDLNSIDDDDDDGRPITIRAHPGINKLNNKPTTVPAGGVTASAENVRLHYPFKQKLKKKQTSEEEEDEEGLASLSPAALLGGVKAADAFPTVKAHAKSSAAFGKGAAVAESRWHYFYHTLHGNILVLNTSESSKLICELIMNTSQNNR